MTKIKITINKQTKTMAKQKNNNNVISVSAFGTLLVVLKKTRHVHCVLNSYFFFKFVSLFGYERDGMYSPVILWELI